MSATALLLRPDGTATVVTALGRKWTLQELQGHVGGYIERVGLDDMARAAVLRWTDQTAYKGPLDMVVNEEGRLQDLPFNELASILARTIIVGNALVITRGAW